MVPMVTSLRKADVDPLIDSVIDLVWSLWSEAGVSSWQKRHSNWLVEVEPLIGLTAAVGNHDPRLLRESVDWCVKNHRHVSLKQLRHVVTTQQWRLEGEIARFGATVGEHSNQRWPGVTNERPYDLRLSYKSAAPDLERPALFSLRMRAAFGISARAEIIKTMILRPREWSVKQLSGLVAYTSRQIALDLEMLVASGLMRRSEWSTPALYSLHDPSALVGIFGHLPRIAPRWAPLFGFVVGVIGAFERLASETLRSPAAELRRQVRQLERSIDEAGLSPPVPHPHRDYVGDFLGWSLETFAALAAADPTPVGPNALVGAAADPARLA
jgi:hypothetical protein